MLENIKKSTDFINNQFSFKPLAGVIAGTGLGGLVTAMDVLHIINYNDIPGFPQPTVEGHEGRMVFGHINSKNIVVLQGRYHYYEGYTMEQVTFPVRILKQLGIRYLILTNASGALNPDFNPGDLMIHTDHINLMPNPLIGIHHSETGDRFPDMSGTYNSYLNQKVRQIAGKKGIMVHEGCYVGVTGPTYETPAEYHYYRLIGGDTVGMSTIPEVIIANQMGIKCAAISVITNSGSKGKSKDTSHKQVLSIAQKAAPLVSQLISGLVNELS